MIAAHLTNAAIAKCKRERIPYDEARCIVVHSFGKLELYTVCHESGAALAKRRAKDHGHRKVHVWTLKTLRKQEVGITSTSATPSAILRP